jgi:type IV secretion system protein VirD4
MAVTDAQMMADALVEGKEDHWNSSARGLITGLLLHVATAPDIKTRDLPTLRTLLMGDLNATLKAMTQNSQAPQEVRDVGAWGMGAAENEWSSIVSNAIEQTKWLASPQIADCLRSGGDQVDFSAYRDSVQSVFICLPAPYFRTFSKWLRLVVAASIDTLTKQLNPDMPLPTRFVLDELAQLGMLEKVESALTLSAGYGVQLWGIWQHLKDIERCYPRSGVAGWVSSSGVRLVFATQDNDSVRYFAGMCGGAMSETDIRQMAQGQMLCLLDGQNPLIVERVPYYEWHTAKPAQPKPKPAEKAAPDPLAGFRSQFGGTEGKPSGKFRF